MTLDDNVATLANLAGFGRDRVRGTGVRAGEVVVVQLVLGSHCLSTHQMSLTLPMVKLEMMQIGHAVQVGDTFGLGEERG